MDIDKYEELLEALRTGTPSETLVACEKLIKMWRDVSVEELLLLKNKFSRVGLDDREARLDEALMSIAEKRPAPFTTIVTHPDHPLWSEAVDVLAMLGCEDHLDLFISLLPQCPAERMADLVRGIGCYRDDRVVESLSRQLGTGDEEVFTETVLALKRCGGQDALEALRNARRSRGGMEFSRMLDAVITEMEMDMDAAEVPDTQEA